MLKPKSGWFSRQPLNYETWTQRLNHARTKGRMTSNMLIDCIEAARSIQRSLGSVNINSRPSSSFKQDFLNITTKSVSSQLIETNLVNFLDLHSDLMCDEQVLKNYLLVSPPPENAAKMIQWTSGVVNKQIDDGVHWRKRSDIVFSTLRQILRLKDYHNAFNLIDNCLTSDSILKANTTDIMVASIRYFGVISVASILVALCNVYLGAFCLAVGSTYSLLVSRILRTSSLNRVFWRPHNRFLYQLPRENELYAVNMIISHYEEHAEINVKNFHHSEVREIADINQIESRDYILETPKGEDIQSMIKEQVRKRRMVLHDLQEELMFLDFWLSQGDFYEWVEPDQDPAEIIKLKTQKEL